MELSPESRYRRFLHGGAVPTEALLDYLTNVDQDHHVAIGATITSPDLKTERGVGIARFIRLDSRPDVAEAAVTVVDDMHRRGVGTALLRELLRAARCRGIKRIRAEVLAENGPMRAILERVGAEKVMEESGAGTIAWELEIDEHRPAVSSSFFDVLRGAAETMAMRFRR
jgi:RimJ/RimL family protein N-acetyltransferase